MHFINWFAAALLAAFFAGGWNTAAAAPSLRVGVLEFGTVNWELDVIREHGLDRKHGFELEVTGLGSKNATAVALQSRAVDMIVTDFVWVARRRGHGADYVFYPHSTAAGAVMVRADAGIVSPADLAGRQLGIAGGPVDKSWLLLRAYFQQRYQRDLAREVEPRFAAPPLLNKLMLRGELPAVINFWHYGARLSAQGMQHLIGIDEVVRALGIERPVALIGWVFGEAWARQNPELVAAFLRATREAKQLLATSDAEWRRLAPRTRADDETTLIALRDAYRAGIPTAFDAAHRDAAARLYRILAELGGSDLVGDVEVLPAGVFWTGQDY
jgi:NitT/TauT family transport system substrate-binding protein